MTDQKQADPTAAGSLITRDQFRRIADLAFRQSKGDDTFITLYDAENGTTRFANNQIVQNVSPRRIMLAVKIAFGRQHGTATITDFGEEAVRDAVERAERIARVSPADPEYMAPLPPQEYPRISTARDETIRTGPAGRVALAAEAIDLCKAEGLTAAGIVTSSVTAVGLAASSGLFAYEPRTEARFSVTVMGDGASGWGANVHRSIERLDVSGRTRLAIQKARRATNPRELPPGRYTVILEPAAVSGLIGPLIWMLDAKSYDKQTSPFTGKLGRRIIDSRLTLRNFPDHPALLGNSFNAEGLPTDGRVWIEGGVLKQLWYDRYTAQEHHVHPTPSLDAPYLSGSGEGHQVARNIEELISNTSRGILITNFWYIRTVNPADLTLTGMTRDGTFLIEDGRISTAVVDFRWHDSPLRALNHVEAFTAPADAVSNEHWKMQLPALKIRDFHFSSVTRF